jgi:hypothetical protein
MKCAAAVAASLLLAPLTRPAEQIIQATYSDRPPYLLPQADGSPAGLTGAPAAAFKASGIPVRWRGCRPTANWRWSRIQTA